MRYRLFYLILFVLLLLDFTIAISNPKPKLTVIFDEEVEILTINLTNSAKENLTINLIDKGKIEQETKTQYKFVYQPKENLNEDRYEFNVTVQDTVGNKKAISQNFTIAYADLEIILIEPNYGVTSVETINILLTTKRDAECRYSEKTNIFDIMTRFSETNSQTHKQEKYSLQNAQTKLYVTCKDLGTSKLYTKDFNIVIDKDKPIINSLSVLPDAIYEGIPP
ncbi:MAG: Ig-like domain-containing protein, partial [Nanoarchaeota archaeon]